MWPQSGAFMTLRRRILVGERRWPARIPLSHPPFLRDLAPMHQEGRYLFVHTGICPHAPLNQQARHCTSGWQIR